MAALAHHSASARARVDFDLRKTALLCIVTCQLWLAPGLSASALADGSTGAPPGSELAPEAPAPPAGGQSEPAPVMPPQTPGGETGGPAPQTPLQPPGGGSGVPSGATPPGDAGAGASSTTASTTPAPSSTSSAPRAGTPAPAVASRRMQKTSASKQASRDLTTTHHVRAGKGNGKAGKGAGKGSKGGAKGAKDSKGAAPATTDNVALPPRVVAAEARALAAELAGSGGSARALAFYRIPLFLLPIYQAAAVRYGVPWQILAAINEIETDYGSDLSVSSAGAEGWMQFEPSTWLQYGVDAVNAGYADPYNPVDAIFAAARYLRAAGAPSDLRAAILAYNHSAAYVESVLLRAKLISSWPKPVIATLTGLVDSGLPVSGRTLAWEMLAPPAASSAGATAAAGALASKTGAGSPAGSPASSAAPTPSAAAAGATGARAGATHSPQRVDLMSARDAAVLAVQGGRIVKLGRSRKLGFYVALRDVHGDLFTYSGLGGIARDYTPPRASATHAPDAGSKSGRSDRRPSGPDRPLPLRIGSLVGRGTVLGHVRVPRGAKDGHLLFSIRPAGDPNTIDPIPILVNWTRLHAALHPRGATGELNLLGAGADAGAGVTGAAHAASARPRTAPSPVVLGGGLTATQWDALIAHIAQLPAPAVAVKPSSAAIPDPGKGSSSPTSGRGALSFGR